MHDPYLKRSVIYNMKATDSLLLNYSGPSLILNYPAAQNRDLFDAIKRNQPSLRIEPRAWLEDSEGWEGGPWSSLSQGCFPKATNISLSSCSPSTLYLMNPE